MGKLTLEETVREYNRGRKAVDEGRHVIGVSLGHIRSNPMNIMKSVGRHSSRVMISVSTTQPKLEVKNWVSEG